MPDTPASVVRWEEAVDANDRKVLTADEAFGSSSRDGPVRVERVYEVPYLCSYSIRSCSSTLKR